MMTLLPTPASRHGPRRLDVPLDRAEIAGLQRADVEHHVDLARPVEDGPARLVVLHVGRRGAQRESPPPADADQGNRAASRAASATHVGFTHTVAKRYSPASAQSVRYRPRVASGLSSV